MKYALVSPKNIVINIIKYDGKNEWRIPKGCRLIQSDCATIRDWYDETNNTFIKTHPITPL